MRQSYLSRVCYWQRCRHISQFVVDLRNEYIRLRQNDALPIS
jgi:hypothetical protein